MTGLFNRQNQALCRPLVTLLPEVQGFFICHIIVIQGITRSEMQYETSPSSSLLTSFIFSLLPSCPPALFLCDPSPFSKKEHALSTSPLSVSLAALFLSPHRHFTFINLRLDDGSWRMTRSCPGILLKVHTLPVSGLGTLDQVYVSRYYIIRPFGLNT